MEQGIWTLRIIDLSASSLASGIDLKSWTLVLCPIGDSTAAADYYEVAASQGPVDPETVADEAPVTDEAPTAPEAGAGASSTNKGATSSLRPLGSLVSNAQARAANTSGSARLVLDLLDRLNRSAP